MIESNCTEESGSSATAFYEGAGFADASDRTRIDLTGKDRTAFLHRLTTNDIQRLAVGHGCEVFFPNVQGKTIGHGFVFSAADTLQIDADPGQTAALLTHLDRYLIRDDVQLLDRAGSVAEWFLAGPKAVDVLRTIGLQDPPTIRCSHAKVCWMEMDVVVRRVDLLGPETYLIEAAREHAAQVADQLIAAGAVRCNAEQVEARRIEFGSPLFGKDISSENLPQELVRDDKAISFNKGCYLGQETIARLDALGHVNRTLVRLNFLPNDLPEAAIAPPAGTELFAAEKSVGKITSSAVSLRHRCVTALAFVRRGHNTVGTRLQTSFGDAVIVAAE